MKISATNGGNSARMKFNISVSKSHRRLTFGEKEWKVFVSANRMEEGALCAFSFKVESGKPSVSVSYHE